jgi:rare lipoprotein A
VQVLPQRREPDPDWSTAAAPIQQSAPPVNPPDRVFASVQKAYRVQAGSFSNRENAEKAVRQLAGAGRASIDAIERPSGTLYRVTVNAGQDEGEAWSLRDRVESLGYQGATILKP